MRKIIFTKITFLLFVFLIGGSHQTTAQSTAPVPIQKVIYNTLIHEVVVTEFDFIEKKGLEKKKIMFDHVVFDIVEELNLEGKDVKIVKPISFIKRKKRDSDKDIAEAGVKDKFEQVVLEEYYYVSSSDLEKNTVVYTPRSWEMRAGIVTIPVKFYLPKDGRKLDFSSKSVSLGTSVGVGQQISQSKQNLWINYLFGAHFTMLTQSQDDFVNFNLDSSDNTLSAFSLSLGVALNFEGIEFGVFLGKDFLPGSAADDWVHNGETWFSVGVGTSLGGGKDKLTNY